MELFCEAKEVDEGVEDDDDVKVDEAKPNPVLTFELLLWLGLLWLWLWLWFGLVDNKDDEFGNEATLLWLWLVILSPWMLLIEGGVGELPDLRLVVVVL